MRPEAFHNVSGLSPFMGEALENQAFEAFYAFHIVPR